MKKPTKSSLTRKLDTICSQIIRSHGQCMMCAISDYELLQCCHIFSRTFRNTRWDLKNLVCLCAKCHFLTHRNPILFAEWVRRHLGEYEYSALKLRHTAIKKWQLWEMQDHLNALEELRNGKS